MSSLAPSTDFSSVYLSPSLLRLKKDFLTDITDQIEEMEEYLDSTEVLKAINLEKSSVLLGNIRNSVFDHEMEISSKLREFLNSESQEVIDSAIQVSKRSFTPVEKSIAWLQNQASSQELIIQKGQNQASSQELIIQKGQNRDETLQDNHQKQHLVSASPLPLVEKDFLLDITAQIHEVQEYLLHARGLKRNQVEKSFTLLTSIRNAAINREVEMSSKLLTQEFIQNKLLQIIKISPGVSKPSLDSIAKGPLEKEICRSTSETTSVTKKRKNSDEPHDVKRQKFQSASETPLPLVIKDFLSYISRQIDEMQIYLNNIKFLRKDQLEKCFGFLCNMRITIIYHAVENDFEIHKQKFLRSELPKIL